MLILIKHTKHRKEEHYTLARGERFILKSTPVQTHPLAYRAAGNC